VIKRKVDTVVKRDEDKREAMQQSMLLTGRRDEKGGRG